MIAYFTRQFRKQYHDRSDGDHKHIQDAACHHDGIGIECSPGYRKIKDTNFYKAGKAMEAMEAYPDANEKFMELQDHYARISTLVIHTLEKMIETDEAIAAKIIEALEV